MIGDFWGDDGGFDLLSAGAELAIIAAQREEVQPLLARLSSRRRGQLQSVPYWTGGLAGTEVLVAISGVGQQRARIAAEELLSQSVPFLMVVGVAGALSPELEIGCILAAEEVWAEGAAALACDREILALASARPRVQVGAILTLDHIVATVAERASLLRSLGSPAAAVAVDMESWDFLDVAKQCAVPCTVLRAISDASRENLPTFLERGRRPDGTLDRGRVALSALARPASIPSLLALRRRVRVGAEELAELVENLAPSAAAVAP